ncbi:undecaprenyl-diphosphatase UppP [Patescibacteria group bacterium]|nr:undecaprenyl-diphosphatase UppP [Patescibacteria group bacterium]
MDSLLSFSILGALEGLTEFLPISSTGHLIVARDFFSLSTGNDLAVDAVLQLATILALVVYFRRDLYELLRTALALVSRKSAGTAETALLISIIVGTIPALVFGLMLEDIMATIFRSSTLVAYALIAGSVIMLAAEWLRPKTLITIPDISPRRAMIIGLFQSLALIPGMSRSGMTTAGGMFLGLSRSESTRFGFILSIPILIGAGSKKAIELATSGALSSFGVELVIGSVIAFVIGVSTIHLFLTIARKTPLTVFVAYRLALAVFILIYLGA